MFKTILIKLKTSAILALCFCLVASCGSSPQQKPNKSASPFTYVDSTEYFANRTASASMRATFTTEQPSGMAQGYRFQFRTLSKNPAFLNSISIVAGGKRYFLEEGQIVLPREKGITLQLPLSDSLEAAKFPSALLQFRYNNSSYIFAIELHQLKTFVPN
jgi:hypothetical protein